MFNGPATKMLVSIQQSFGVRPQAHVHLARWACWSVSRSRGVAAAGAALVLQAWRQARVDFRVLLQEGHMLFSPRKGQM